MKLDNVDRRLASLLTMSSRSGMLTSALTRGILSTSSGKGLCLTLYLIPTSLFGVGRPSGTNTCCGRRRVGRGHDDRHSYNICATDGEQQDVRMLRADSVCVATGYSWGHVCFGCGKLHSVISPSDWPALLWVGGRAAWSTHVCQLFLWWVQWLTDWGLWGKRGSDISRNQIKFESNIYITFTC